MQATRLEFNSFPFEELVGKWLYAAIHQDDGEHLKKSIQIQPLAVNG